MLLEYNKLTFNSGLRSSIKVLKQTHLILDFYLFNQYYSTNNSYLLKVSVAPRFTICKYLRGDSAILVILHAYRHGTSLDTCHMPSRGVGDIYSIQTTAWSPQSGPSSMIIVDT